jgi:uncharacterized protein YggT (Ycf19 family)
MPREKSSTRHTDTSEGARSWRGGAAAPEPRHESPSELEVQATGDVIERRTDAERRIAQLEVEEERRVAERRAARLESLVRRRKAVERVTHAVDYVFYLLYGVLAIRFVLALVGASETAGFVQFINGLTQPFYVPFAGIVARPSVDGGIFDMPALIAVLAYVVLHLAVRGLLRVIAARRPLA